VCFCSCLYRFLFKKSDIFNVIEPLRKNETQKKKKEKTLSFSSSFFASPLRLVKWLSTNKKKSKNDKENN